MNKILSSWKATDTLIVILITCIGVMSYKIGELNNKNNELQYSSVDNAVECIGKIGNMTKQDVDYCRPLLISLGFKEREQGAE